MQVQRVCHTTLPWLISVSLGPTMPHSTEAIAALQKFVARINAHDPIGIMALCNVDHVFIDSLG